ncbi:MAG TPA: cytochrome c3 family protein [Sphingobium sp.]|uniref:cytochrome c3 family protein n=1 Tax=Sphingobium sp. TaxID=1912891 RepID=UPI002ED069C3
MAFLIRTITITADGREIIRDRRVEKPLISVGRAAERDIHLQDLAVGPDQARIEQLDDRRLLVRSVGSLGFTIDGRASQRVEIDSAVGAEIGLGGHRITVGREGDAVVLTVRREGAVSDAAGEKDEAEVFSLKGKMPGKRSVAWALSILILVIFLAIPITSFALRSTPDNPKQASHVVGDKAWSPGKLSTAHHALEGNCEACHVKAFQSVRDESCKACHADAHDHAPAARIAGARATPGPGGILLQGVARAFGKPGPGACVDCHREHEGEGAMPPTPQQFCTDCHGTLKQRLTDTKLGDASDFGTAHPEFRPLVAVKPGVPGGHPTFERISLAQRPADLNGLKFPHDLHLSTTNGVAKMARTMQADFGFGDALACKDCHKPTADGVRFQPVDMEKNCQMCHSLAFDRIGGTVRTLRHGKPDQVEAELRAYYRTTGPVAPMELGGAARRRPGLYAQGQVYNAYFGAGMARPARAEDAIAKAFSPKGVCGECHVVSPPGAGVARGWQVAPVHQTGRFLQNGWFSHEAHKTEKCESCHTASRSAKASDLLLPDLKSCRTCHGGEGSSAKVPSGCALCHNYHVDDGAPWLVTRKVAQSASDRGGRHP